MIAPINCCADGTCDAHPSVLDAVRSVFFAEWDWENDRIAVDDDE